MKKKEIEKLLTNEQYKDYLYFMNNSIIFEDELKSEIEDNLFVLGIHEGEKRTDTLYAKILTDEEIEKYSLNYKVNLFTKTING